MNLDKRIKALTDIQSVTDGCHDWDFMIKKGYFADRIINFTDLSTCTHGTYVDYREHDKCFHCEVNLPDGTSDYTWYTYFIPEDVLIPEEPEKKYRAFSLNEFLKQYKVGDLIEFRRDGYEEVEHAMFTGYVTNPDESDDKNTGENQIIIGGMRYSFAYLFEYYKLFFEDKWQPFGVIVEENE